MTTASTHPPQPGQPATVTLPVLPAKGTVVFPGSVLPLTVGREKSVSAVDAAAGTEEKTIIIVAQRDSTVEEPNPPDLFNVGTRAVIRRLQRGDEHMELIVQGVDRVRLDNFDLTEPHLRASVSPVPKPDDAGPEVEALQRAVIDLTQRVVELAQPDQQVDIRQLANQAQDPLSLVFLIASMLALDLDKSQSLLEAPTNHEALRQLHENLAHEAQVMDVRRQIASQVQSELSKEQREAVLRRQLRAIQQELGEESSEQAEVQALRQRLEEADLPDHVREQAERGLNRMERTPSISPEFQVTRGHLELLLELPWKTRSEDQLDVQRAREILDEDHYDLEEIKERILDHLAVMKLNPDAHAPSLCFVGPPGVGKTSLGQSIARALGRKFERMSLGGMHDESELRGHRRTYVGAMPGRVIQAIRRAGVNNPLLMLDEVDKLGVSFRGDPASALLEILDPAQNFSFRDNYLDFPFDLSSVFFITTANTTDTIPSPLLDRMEVLQLSGYSDEEKLHIARRYLIPRRIEHAGLKPEKIDISDKIVNEIIRRYTREAGVRQLERAIGRLTRKVARQFAEGRTDSVKIKPEDLPEMLGSDRRTPEKAREHLPPGVAAGLAWTEAGGQTLYIEATLLPRGKRLRLTGSLGDVMRESAKAAQSYIWSHARDFAIDEKVFRENGVHLHVPSGAVPKDGPSAGVAMATALASAYANTPARADTAMTGEISLAGLVMPVGGIKEKILAARRAGIRRIIIPKDNEKDLRDVPEHVREEIEIIPAERIEEVFAAAIPGLSQLQTSGSQL